MLYYKFVNFSGRGLLIRFILIVMSLLFICNTSLLAADSIEESAKEDGFYQLPELFFQDIWVESEDNVIVYLLNLQEIDREVTESSSFQAYLTEEANSDMGWSYSKQEEIIEFINLNNKRNSLTINNSDLNLNKSKNYTSWLMAYKGQSSEILIRERTLSVDRVKRAEEDRILEISVTPQQLSFKEQEILTEINFHYGSSSDENTVKTTIWLDNTSVQTLAVISKTSRTANGERRQYYALQLAAASLPVEQLSTIDGNFLAVGNLNGLNKIFDNDDINNDDINNKIEDLSSLSIRIGSNGEQFAYNHSRGKNKYNIELNKSSRYQGLNYSINAELSLIQDKDLFLSLRVGNENNIKLGNRNYENYDKNSDIYIPVIRIGLKDQVNWGDRFSLGISYYPLSVQIKDDKDILENSLWEVSALYKITPWSLRYIGGFLGNRRSQKLTMEYLLEENKTASITYGRNYDNEAFFSIGYSFSFFTQ